MTDSTTTSKKTSTRNTSLSVKWSSLAPRALCFGVIISWDTAFNGISIGLGRWQFDIGTWRSTGTRLAGKTSILKCLRCGHSIPAHEEDCDSEAADVYFSYLRSGE